MTQKRILVLGRTGMLGNPAARKLHEDGFQVRLMVRDVEKTQNLFDGSYEITRGDVSDMDSLEAGLEGCSGVILSVGGQADQLSAENVSALANPCGIEQIVYLSGSTVCEQNRWFPMTAQKLEAEQAIQESGVAYTILRPTWPMEQLPRFVMGERATVIGVLPDPWHWFASKDLARMISNAFKNPEAKGKHLYIHGPEGIPIKEALERYCQAFHPAIEAVTVLPIETAKQMAGSSGNTFLMNFAILMEYFKKVGEPGDSTEANHILGAPTITLDDWLKEGKT